MNTREYEQMVRDMRKTLPAYNLGRRVRVLSVMTAKGQDILRAAQQKQGYHIWDVYENPSKAKQELWEQVHEMYINDENSRNFHICSHNTFQFTVAWICDDNVTVYLTRDTEYVIPG